MVLKSPNLETKNKCAAPLWNCNFCITLLSSPAHGWSALPESWKLPAPQLLIRNLLNFSFMDMIEMKYICIWTTTPRTNTSVNGTTAVVKKILHYFLRFYFTTAVVPFTLVFVRGVVKAYHNINLFVVAWQLETRVFTMQWRENGRG